jgi:hypothetical protein
MEISDIVVNRINRFKAGYVFTYSDSDLVTITMLALKYNPGTRALAGAIIDQESDPDITESLLKSLNPVSLFSYNISDEGLDNKLKWRLSPVLE